MPTRRPAIGPHIHDPVRPPHDLEIMLHHEHRVAGVAQVVERRKQGLVVCGMQAGTRLIQHVHHAEQVRPDLRGEAQALQFAGGERGGGALQRQVAQSQRVQRVEPREHIARNALCGNPLLRRVVRCATHIRRRRMRPRT